MMLQRIFFHPLCVIILLAISLRAAVMVREGGAFDDPDNYLTMARSLLEGKGFTLRGRPTAYRPPLYPVVLAPLVALGNYWGRWGIALMHMGLGAGTVWMTAVAAERFGLSRIRVMSAALVVACDPVLIWQCRSVMTETPAAFLIAASLAALSKGGTHGAVEGGVWFGLAALCRPSLLAGTILTTLASALVRPGELSHRLLRSAVLAISVSIVLLPWIIRNFLVLGEPIATTTHGGYTLALANNPVYYREILNGPPGRVWAGEEQRLWWESVNRATKGMSEPQADRYFQATVWQLAREQPTEFARASLARLGHFFNAWPAASVYHSSVRWASLAWTVPLWIALVIGLCMKSLWQWPRIAAPMIVIGLTIVHAFFWTDLRMRAPIVPAIALIAATAELSRFRLRRPRPVYRDSSSKSLENR